MKDYLGYFIDLDGTVYHGGEPIPAAVDFVKTLQQRQVPYLFVTNNSARPPEDVAAKLQHISIPARRDQVLTSSMTTAHVLADEGIQSACIIGEQGLRQALEEQNIQLTSKQPDAVVVGIDRAITYEKLATALQALQHGAAFYATNSDVVIPTEEGMLPGNGSLTAVLSTATGQTPRFIGKPQKAMIDDGLQILGLQPHDVLMVGDNYATDIKAGMNAGIDTLMVHTGVTSAAELAGYKQQPTYARASLADWSFS